MHRNRALFDIHKIRAYYDWLLRAEAPPVVASGTRLYFKLRFMATTVTNLRTEHGQGTLASERQRLYTQRHDAFLHYQIIDGRLYRKPSAIEDSEPGPEEQSNDDEPEEQLQGTTGRPKRIRKIFTQPRLVVHAEQVFDIIKDVHIQLGHIGYRKTFSALQERYYVITKNEVLEMLKHCQICWLKGGQPKIPPVVGRHVWERVQIDLIDMRSEPDGEFRWILHVIDHFSKFTSLYALRNKQAVEVAAKLAEWIAHGEPPTYLCCDNGEGFKGVLLVLLKKYGIHVKNGCPRTPQTRGLAAQADNTVRRKLAAYRIDNHTAEWVTALPEISLQINHSVHGSSSKTPFELVFGRKARTPKKVAIPERNTMEIEDEVAPQPEVDVAVSRGFFEFEFQDRILADSEEASPPRAAPSGFSEGQLEASDLEPILQRNPPFVTTYLPQRPAVPSASDCEWTECNGSNFQSVAESIELPLIMD